MKLAFYGGTFNPPHNGHKMIIEECACLFDKLLIFPNNISPDKKQELLISNKHRINMLKMIINHKNVFIDEFELLSENISYTYYTIQYLLKKYSNDDITMIIGKDQLLNLKNWYKYEYILKNINILCYDRNVDGDFHRFEFKNIKFKEFDFPYSSKYIRNKIKSSKILDKSLMSNSMIDYIDKNNLYK